MVKVGAFACVLWVVPVNGQTHFLFTSNTGNNATVGIPAACHPSVDGAPLVSGDEIGAFSPSGLCVGAVVWNEQNAALTVWGDNSQTVEIDGMLEGDSIHYCVWRKSSAQEYRGVTVRYSQGNGLYTTNGLYILSALTAVSPSAVGIQNEMVPDVVLSPNWPNPFNPSTSIQFGLPFQAHVLVEVFDAVGKRVAVVLDKDQGPGFHRIFYEPSEPASGVYICRLTAGDRVRVQKMIMLH